MSLTRLTSIKSRSVSVIRSRFIHSNNLSRLVYRKKETSRGKSPNMASAKNAGKSTSAAMKGGKSNEEVFAGFQSLRNEQRVMANKLSEMEMELNEHKIVIDTLKNVDPARKCYRMIGGILCERTVKEITPTLISNKEQLTKVIEALNEQLAKKGVEINEYKEKHNIRIRGQDELQQPEDEEKQAKRNAIVVNPIEV